MDTDAQGILLALGAFAANVNDVEVLARWCSDSSRVFPARVLSLDDGGMGGRRVVVLVTAVLVALLAVTLTVLRWDEANKVAVVVSALAAVAAVGVGVWAALPRGGSSTGGSSAGGWRVSRSGAARAGRGGRAVSGVAGRSGSLPGEVQVDRSGEARAEGDGDAVSGISGD